MMNRKKLGFGVAIATFLVAVTAFAYTYIYLGAPIGDGGSFPVLGSSNIVFASDATHVVTTGQGGELSGGAFYVTSSVSLTATRLLQMPLLQGEVKDVYNATTGGQTINVGGASGSTVAIAPNTYARVYCPDGANYVALSGSGGGGGFDSGAFSGQPGFLYYDGGTTVWRNLSSTDIPPNAWGALQSGSLSPAASAKTVLLDCSSVDAVITLPGSAADGATINFFVAKNPTPPTTTAVRITYAPSGTPSLLYTGSNPPGTAQSTVIFNATAGMVITATYSSTLNQWTVG